MIRPATPADLDAIMDIERRSFPTDAWSAELMTSELDSPHGQYFVAVEPCVDDGLCVDDGRSAGAGAVGAAGSGAAGAAGFAAPHERIVGYGGVRALRGSADSDIQTIALDAAHRGSGRGRALLRVLLQAAAERGARETFLEVRADNPVAAGLYASEGFVEIGRRHGYYQPDDVAAIIMRLDLGGRRLAGPGESGGPDGPDGPGESDGPGGGSAAPQEYRTNALLQDDSAGSVLRNDNRPVNGVGRPADGSGRPADVAGRPADSAGRPVDGEGSDG